MIDADTQEMIEDFFEDVLEDIEGTKNRIDILEDIVFRADALLATERLIQVDEEDEEDE